MESFVIHYVTYSPTTYVHDIIQNDEKLARDSRTTCSYPPTQTGATYMPYDKVASISAIDQFHEEIGLL